MSALPGARGWSSVELRRLVKTSGGMTPSKAVSAFWGGDVPWVSPKDMKTFRVSGSIDTITTAAVRMSGIELLAPGAVLMVTRGMILDHTVPIALNEVPVTVNQDMKALVCLRHLQPEYLAWTLLGHQDELLARVEVAGHGTCALRTDQWGGVALPLPPLDEQTQIAKFLDYETAKIDQLIDKQQQLIALLEEKRQAVISHAVTKGLNPDAPMKDSGVEWLGQVPTHWEVKHVHHIVDPNRQVMYGIVLPGPDVRDGVPIVKGGDVKPERLCLSRLKKTTFDIERKCARSRLKAGDIVYAIRGGVGDVELVPLEIEGANLTQDAARIAPGLGVHPGWLLMSLRGDYFWRQIERRITGATVRGINIYDLKRAMVAVPPKREQLAIAEFLDARLANLRELSSNLEAFLATLKERRTALISAAVTGKIDVRNWQPPEGEATQEVA